MCSFQEWIRNSSLSPFKICPNHKRSSIVVIFQTAGKVLLQR